MELAHRDLDANARQEADEDAAGEEVGQETETQETGGQQDDAHEQSGHPCHRHVLRRPGRQAEGRQPGRQDDGGGGIRPDDEMPRRAQKGEQEDGDDDRVEPGDHGHPGHRGVAHGLGDGQRGQRRAGEHVHRHAGRVDREEPLEDREARACLRRRRHASSSRHDRSAGLGVPMGCLPGPVEARGAQRHYA